MAANIILLREWSQNEKKEAQELITGYTSIFAISKMDFHRLSLVKHSLDQHIAPN